MSTASSDVSPQWFDNALATPATVSGVEVDGTSVSYRSWGDFGGAGPDLLLVHGGGAHARWWDHIAPMLAVDRRVVAIDISGHGDSGHRAAYSLEGWADECVAVMRHAGFGANPVIIGHSLGGLVTAVLAAHTAPGLSGVIIIDSPIEPTGFSTETEADEPSFRHARVYPFAVAPIDRFRPVPAQESLPYIARHIAENSVRPNEAGWSWKFDPGFVDLTGEVPRTLDGLNTRVVLIAGEHGILSDEARRAFDESTEVGVVEVTDAGHAIMLDQPVALVAAIRGVLAGWG